MQYTNLSQSADDLFDEMEYSCSLPAGALDTFFDDTVDIFTGGLHPSEKRALDFPLSSRHRGMLTREASERSIPEAQWPLLLTYVEYRLRKKEIESVDLTYRQLLDANDKIAALMPASRDIAITAAQLASEVIAFENSNLNRVTPLVEANLIGADAAPEDAELIAANLRWLYARREQARNTNPDAGPWQQYFDQASASGVNMDALPALYEALDNARNAAFDAALAEGREVDPPQLSEQQARDAADVIVSDIGKFFDQRRPAVPAGNRNSHLYGSAITAIEGVGVHNNHRRNSAARKAVDAAVGSLRGVGFDPISGEGWPQQAWQAALELEEQALPQGDDDWQSRRDFRQQLTSHNSTSVPLEEELLEQLMATKRRREILRQQQLRNAADFIVDFFISHSSPALNLDQQPGPGLSEMWTELRRQFPNSSVKPTRQAAQTVALQAVGLEWTEADWDEWGQRTRQQLSALVHAAMVSFNSHLPLADAGPPNLTALGNGAQGVKTERLRLGESWRVVKELPVWEDIGYMPGRSELDGSDGMHSLERLPGRYGPIIEGARFSGRGHSAGVVTGDDLAEILTGDDGNWFNYEVEGRVLAELIRLAKLQRTKMYRNLETASAIEAGVVSRLSQAATNLSGAQNHFNQWFPTAMSSLDGLCGSDAPYPLGDGNGFYLTQITPRNGTNFFNADDPLDRGGRSPDIVEPEPGDGNNPPPDDPPTGTPLGMATISGTYNGMLVPETGEGFDNSSFLNLSEPFGTSYALTVTISGNNISIGAPGVFIDVSGLWNPATMSFSDLSASEAAPFNVRADGQITESNGIYTLELNYLTSGATNGARYTFSGTNP